MIRYQALGEADVMPKSMLKGLGALPNYSKWSQAVCADESVTFVFDGPVVAASMKARIEKMKAAEAK